MQCLLTVFMDKRNISGRVVDGGVTQRPNTIYLEWSLTLAGTVNVVRDSVFDIYGSYDPSVPTAEPLILNGILAPDRPWQVQIDARGGQSTTLKGYDHSYLLERRHPPYTIVLTPDKRIVASVLAGYHSPIGRYRVLEARSIAQAVRRIAALGGVKVQWELPDPPVRPQVLDPAASYWRLISDLVGPLAPRTYFWPERNTLVFVDNGSRWAGFGGVLNLGDQVNGLTVEPQQYRTTRRVLMRWLR